MTVTWPLPPGSTLADPARPIMFTPGRDVAAVSVALGNRRAEERAYRDGAFVWPYLRSERSGNTFTLVRDDGLTGWPSAPKLFVDEAQTAASLGLPSLAPTLYSPLAQWALDARSPNGLYHDRSGNHRHLTSGAVQAVPDAIPGASAASRPTTRLQRTVDTGLHLRGALTLTARVWPMAGGQYQTIACMSAPPPGPVDRESLYILGTSDLTPYIFWENGSTGRSHAFSTALPTDRWSFVAIRRDSAGVATVDVNAASSSSGPLPLPTSGTSTYLTLLDHEESGSQQWQGGVADVSIWGTRLSDAELAVIRKAMMGVA